jgi:hypothetical protein
VRTNCEFGGTAANDIVRSCCPRKPPTRSVVVYWLYFPNRRSYLVAPKSSRSSGRTTEEEFWTGLLITKTRKKEDTKSFFDRIYRINRIFHHPFPLSSRGSLETPAVAEAMARQAEDTEKNTLTRVLLRRTHPSETRFALGFTGQADCTEV